MTCLPSHESITAFLPFILQFPVLPCCLEAPLFSNGFSTPEIGERLASQDFSPVFQALFFFFQWRIFSRWKILWNKGELLRGRLHQSMSQSDFSTAWWQGVMNIVKANSLLWFSVWLGLWKPSNRNIFTWSFFFKTFVKYLGYHWADCTRILSTNLPVSLYPMINYENKNIWQKFFFTPTLNFQNSGLWLA